MNALIESDPSCYGFAAHNSSINKMLIKFLASNSDLRYLITTDISKCFDSIDQARLFQIVQKLLARHSQNLLVYRTFLIYDYKNKKLINNNACNLLDLPFDAFIEKYFGDKDISLTSPKIVIETSYKHSHNFDLKNFLKFENLITKSHFSTKSTIFKMQKGIPQGMVLSAILCNLYLGNIESNHIAKKLPKSVRILRVIDDYLIGSDSKSDAMLALEIIQKYFNMNPAKVKYNFNETNPESLLPIYWCGNTIKFNDHHKIFETYKQLDRLMQTDCKYWISYPLDSKNYLTEVFIEKLIKYLIIRADKYLISSFVSIETYFKFSCQNAFIILQIVNTYTQKIGSFKFTPKNSLEIVLTIENLALIYYKHAARWNSFLAKQKNLKILTEFVFLSMAKKIFKSSICIR